MVVVAGGRARTPRRRGRGVVHARLGRPPHRLRGWAADVRGTCVAGGPRPAGRPGLRRAAAALRLRRIARHQARGLSRCRWLRRRLLRLFRGPRSRLADDAGGVADRAGARRHHLSPPARHRERLGHHAAPARLRAQRAVHALQELRRRSPGPRPARGHYPDARSRPRRRHIGWRGRPLRPHRSRSAAPAVTGHRDDAGARGLRSGLAGLEGQAAARAGITQGLRRGAVRSCSRSR